MLIHKNADGWFGIEDFSGFIRDCHLKSGWVFHSRITIWKDPVTEMQKTNSHGLLHKNFVQRAQVCRTGLPDYLMVFVKPDPSEQGTPVIQYRQPGDYIGQNAPEPADYAFDTRPAPEYYQGEGVNYNYSIAVWQRYASPVWFDIDQQRVLNTAIARSNEDEKHMAPLQLDVIDRAIDLWTNKGELVLSPFAGVGSEGVESIKLGRRFVGVELKPEYAKWGIANLKEAEIIAQSPRMFE